ncbi:hypothetical protein FRB93_001909 [Tulasnella sp. JGI-2019a]|nr:hypothetical protein FRB93_001909 [Tulasnella sp. JGI-2019a]
MSPYSRSSPVVVVAVTVATLCAVANLSNSKIDIFKTCSSSRRTCSLCLDFSLLTFFKHQKMTCAIVQRHSTTNSIKIKVDDGSNGEAASSETWPKATLVLATATT